MYNEVLNHPNTSDELRRITDAKLLRHKQQYLHSLPTTGDFLPLKKQLAAEVDELIRGVVILEIPDELAWMIFLEGKDWEQPGQYHPLWTGSVR